MCRSRGVSRVTTTSLVGLLALLGSGLPAPASAAVTRSEDPVVVSASLVPELYGTEVSQLFVFRFDTGADAFVPIPFQVDQRVDYVPNPGGTPEVHELMYDVAHRGTGRLAPVDEIAFLYADAGDAAGPTAGWPAGADPGRSEIRVADPRPGGPYPDRFAYVFTGTGLSESATSYVSWNAMASGEVQSSRLNLGFTDRWLLTSYEISAPCGTGRDMIDRAKGRAGMSPTQAETEESWNNGSSYLGGLVGAVRAIRYVQGAASGVYTIHHDVVYRGYWERTVNLRVHVLNNVWFYFDMLPAGGTTFYASTARAGVPVDGVNDPSVGTTLPTWSIVTGPDGGIAMLYTSAPSPFVNSMLFYYRDDAAYNDQPVNPPGYGDEDDSAFGNHGMQLYGLSSSTTDTIPLSFRVYPLCSGVGDASVGDALRQLVDYPLQLSASRQSAGISAIRTLALTRSGFDLGLAWPPVVGATSYRVYTAPSPSLPRGGWTLLGETVSTGFAVTGALADGLDAYYTVAAVVAGDEGPW